MARSQTLFIPLYARILLWFTLNVILLAAGFYFFVRGQLDLGDTLLAGRTGDRIREMAEDVAVEIRNAQPDGWKAVLKRFSQAYNIEFSLAGEGGGPITDMTGRATYPDEIVQILVERGTKATKIISRPGIENADHHHLGSRTRERGADHLHQEENGVAVTEGLNAVANGVGDRGGENGAGQPIRPPELLFLTSGKVDNRYWLGVRIANRYPGTSGPGTAILVGSTPSLSSSRLLPDIKPWLVFAACAAGLSLLIWLPLVLRITRYLRQMTRATQDIASGQFEVIVSEDRRDELGKLGIAINRMSRRLKGYVTGQKRFLGDIAHELCSPIARMQMSLGVLERRLPEKDNELLNDLREEADHMSTMVNELLSFSRSSIRETSIQLKPTDVAEAIDLALQRETGATESVEVRVDGRPKVLADANLLQRAIANVVRNALLYAGECGPIAVTVDRPDDEHTRIRICDQGDGAPDEALERLFDPFFRPETARTRETGGTGLGLSIVKMCIESCRGTVSARNLSPKGFEVTLLLRTASQ